MKRTAAAASNLGQAGAARRRPFIVAAQGEPPEETPAAVERAGQRRAVLLIGGRNGLPAAVLCCCSVQSIRCCQQLPRRCQLHLTLIYLRKSMPASVACHARDVLHVLPGGTAPVVHFYLVLHLSWQT